MHRLLLAGLVSAAVLASAVEARYTTGSIAGRVTYLGRVPEPVYVFESGQAQSLISLDANKGVASAVVSLASPELRPSADAERDRTPEVTINQRNWWFTPAIVVLRAGQPVRFTNDDPSNHSVRSTTGAPANRFGAYTGTGEPYVHHFVANRDGSPVVITCDIHAWMRAWVYVFDHPFYSMTDRTGRFSIDELAPGRYRLSARHGPTGLARDIDVAVTAGRETPIDIVFDTNDLRLPDAF